jgi:MerR family regulatory protein
MFSIGEFARLGAVSVRTLRLYDEMGLLRPARVDPATGYRAYKGPGDRLGERTGRADEAAAGVGAGPGWPQAGGPGGSPGQAPVTS